MLFLLYPPTHPPTHPNKQGHVAALAPSGYIRPTLHAQEDEKGISIKGGRHPCLEMQENVEFIPNDYILTRGTSSLLPTHLLLLYPQHLIPTVSL